MVDCLQCAFSLKIRLVLDLIQRNCKPRCYYIGIETRRENTSIEWRRLSRFPSKNDAGSRASTTYYFVAVSASRQGEANPSLWLATQADKMGPSCPDLPLWSHKKVLL